MEFKEMFRFMKEGAKAKLPHWAGYWEWDPERQTILMHCRPEESDTGADVLDIRESQRVEYTLSNILSDKWIFAFKSNTPKLGGRAYMDSSDALHMMKRWGKKVSRKAWDDGVVSAVIEEDASYFVIKYKDGKEFEYIPDCEDHFAEDWYVVE